MVDSTKHTASNLSQRLRNQLVVTMLCMLPLRHRELSHVTWGDLIIKSNQVVLRIRNEGESARIIDIPHTIIRLLYRWREVIPDPNPRTPLIRRIWKGGRVSKYGLSPDGIWLIVDSTVEYAKLGYITSDDLYRSASNS